MTGDKYSIESIIAELGGEIAILDGGAGPGSFHYADFPRCRIVAVDVKAIMGLDDSPNVERIVGDLAELPFDDNSFDLVILKYVLEHTLKPREVISEAARVLKPNGVIHLSLPDCTSLDDRLFRFAYKLTHPLTWIKFDPDYHYQRFTSDSLRGLLGDYGFSIGIRVIYPGGYNWLPRTMRNAFLQMCRVLGVNPTRSGNLIVHARRGDLSEKVVSIPYVCFDCGLPAEEVAVEHGSWRCRRCGSMNVHFPPSGSM